MTRDWVIAPPWPGREELARRAGVPVTVAQVLARRGLTSPDDVDRFLNPCLNDLHPPESLPGAVPAAARILDAIREQRKIVLYGDYDVDGITGLAILWHAVRLAGGEADYYVPHRVEEGYGLNGAALESLAAAGVRLIVTVDCGITAVEEAAAARRHGVELIITDHHAPRTDERGDALLPGDTLLVHPALNGSGSPNPHLSGAGVALKLAWAIAQQRSGRSKATPEFRDFLVNATGLAALGLIADVVPLRGENRTLAVYGLRGLPASTLPGVAALIDAAALSQSRLTGADVGFRLAPRLNAVGRMGHARLAVELLTRADDAEARRIARLLEQQNSMRRTLEGRIAGEAREQVRATGQDADDSRAIVLASPRWHAGVIGIVAARLVDEFRRPTVLVAVENGSGQGSARSIPGYALHEALADCRAHLRAWGGHAMAGGLRLDAAAFDAFAEAFRRRAVERLTTEDLRRRLMIDDIAPLSALDEELVRDFARMEPFGCENPSPLLASDWLDLVGAPRAVGANGAHLQLTLTDGRVQRRAIAFGQAKRSGELCDHRRCRVAFEPILNDFNGRRTVELQVVDFQFPSREA